MTNVTIPQVEGGETTSPTMGYTAELDDGANSVYSKLSNILKLALPEGLMMNGKISVSVTSNNLTVAIKTTAGNDPSASDPVFVKINGTVRAITSALSLTVAAGANTFNSGGAELATIEIDYFVYLSWKAASSAVVLLASRIPFGRIYSEFSSTATDEKYAAFSAAPASTDDCVVAGRFAATLSAGAGYTWSVPTFTSSNLIHSPIFETRWLTWTPAYTGFSANPTEVCYYSVIGRRLFFHNNYSVAGTSNATTYTMTMPFKSLYTTNIAIGLLYDNGAAVAAGVFQIAAGNNVASLYKSATGAWTNSGLKVGSLQGSLPI